MDINGSNTLVQPDTQRHYDNIKQKMIQKMKLQHQLNYNQTLIARIGEMKHSPGSPSTPGPQENKLMKLMVALFH